MNNRYLEHALVMLEQVERQVRDELCPLNREQLNWKPGTKAWSVAECLDHLAVTNAAYFQVFEDLKNNRLRTGWWAFIPGWTRLGGRILLNTVEPDNGRKVKTFDMFRPSASDYTREITGDFLNSHARFVALIHELDGYEHHEKITVYSPANRLVTLRLNDAINLLWKHEVRHVLQARRVKAMPGFPAAAGW